MSTSIAPHKINSAGGTEALHPVGASAAHVAAGTFHVESTGLASFNAGIAGIETWKSAHRQAQHHPRIAPWLLQRKVRHGKGADAPAASKKGFGTEEENDDGLLELMAVETQGNDDAAMNGRQHRDPQIEHELMRRGLHSEQDRNNLSESIASTGRIANLLQKDDDGASGPVSDLRALYRGRTPTALELVQAMQEAKYSKAQCQNIFAQLAEEVRKNQHSVKPSGPPAHARAVIEEAKTFHLVQSTLHHSLELQSRLSELELRTRGNELDVCAILLGAADADENTAKVFADKLVPLDKLGDKKLADAIQQVRHTVESLPVTLWPPEKLPARLGLLDGLKKLAQDAHDRMGPTNTRDAEFERNLRERAASLARNAKAANEEEAIDGLQQ